MLQTLKDLGINRTNEMRLTVALWEIKDVDPGD